MLVSKATQALCVQPGKVCGVVARLDALALARSEKKNKKVSTTVEYVCNTMMSKRPYMSLTAQAYAD